MKLARSSYLDHGDQATVAVASSCDGWSEMLFEPFGLWYLPAWKVVLRMRPEYTVPGTEKNGTSQVCATDSNSMVGERVQLSTSILITGIGCVGKSGLRRRIASALGPQVVCVDRDDGVPEPVVAPGQIIVVESVHGLDEPPERWSLVVYLLPSPLHTLRWIRRALVWFRTGQVDRPPRSLRRCWSPLNLPLIVRIVARNIWHAHRWVHEDLQRVHALFQDHVVVTSDADEAFREVESFLASAEERRSNECEQIT